MSILKESIVENESPKSEQLLLAEMQVLLAQLRTHLSLVRTGAGMFVASLSLAFLMLSNVDSLPPLLAKFTTLFHGLFALTALLGIGIFARSEAKIVAVGKLIKEAERQNKEIDKIMV